MIPPFLHQFTTAIIQQPIHQVTAMIIKKSKQGEYYLLFLQRAYSEKDAYSGDLCFPGGHREKNQTLVQTAIRETQEETGLKLREEHWIGGINHHFRTRRSLKQLERKTKMGALIFYILQEEINMEIKLDASQIRDYKWVNLSLFFNGKASSLVYWICPVGSQDGITLMDCPAFQLGMKRVLWGLSLMVMSKFLQQITESPVSKLASHLVVNYEFMNAYIHHSMQYKYLKQNRFIPIQYDTYMGDSAWVTFKHRIAPKF